MGRPREVEAPDLVVAPVDRHPRVLAAASWGGRGCRRGPSAGRRSPGSGRPAAGRPRSGWRRAVSQASAGTAAIWPRLRALRLGRVEDLGHRQLEPRQVVAEVAALEPRRVFDELGQVVAEAVQAVAPRGVDLHVAADQVEEAVGRRGSARAPGSRSRAPRASGAGTSPW